MTTLNQLTNDVIPTWLSNVILWAQTGQLEAAAVQAFSQSYYGNLFPSLGTQQEVQSALNPLISQIANGDISALPTVVAVKGAGAATSKRSSLGGYSVKTGEKIYINADTLEAYQLQAVLDELTYFLSNFLQSRVRYHYQIRRTENIYSIEFLRLLTGREIPGRAAEGKGYGGGGDNFADLEVNAFFSELINTLPRGLATTVVNSSIPPGIAADIGQVPTIPTELLSQDGTTLYKLTLDPTQNLQLFDVGSGIILKDIQLPSGTTAPENTRRWKMINRSSGGSVYLSSNGDSIPVGLARYDKDLNLLWEAHWSGTSVGQQLDICDVDEAGDGSTIVCGTITGKTSIGDPLSVESAYPYLWETHFISKVSVTGEIAWTTVVPLSGIANRVQEVEILSPTIAVVSGTTYTDCQYFASINLNTGQVIDVILADIPSIPGFGIDQGGSRVIYTDGIDGTYKGIGLSVDGIFTKSVNTGVAVFGITLSGYSNTELTASCTVSSDDPDGIDYVYSYEWKSEDGASLGTGQTILMSTVISARVSCLVTYVDRQGNWTRKMSEYVYPQTDATLTPVNLTGSIITDTVVSGSGNNIVSLLSGNDFAETGAGNDSVYGGSGNDTVVGGSGEGDDLYDGGEGTDIVSYLSTVLGVKINLANGVASGSEIGNDTLISIENIVLGKGLNEFSGDVQNNMVIGESGTEDLVILKGPRSEYQVEKLGDRVYSIKDGSPMRDGLDRYSHIEMFRFSDMTLLEGQLMQSGTRLVSGNYDFTITGTPASGKVVATQKVTVGRKTSTETKINETFTNVQTVEITAGASANILNAQAWTGDSKLKGEGGNDTLTGGSGITTYTGGLGADKFRFVVKPEFTAALADHITHFLATEKDKIEISRTAFGIAKTAKVSVATVNGSIAREPALAKTSLFVYDSSTGELWWNQNGSTAGAGTGGVFAVLDNKPAVLSASSIGLV